jgi:hypothetical protein
VQSVEAARLSGEELAADVSVDTAAYGVPAERLARRRGGRGKARDSADVAMETPRSN